MRHGREAGVGHTGGDGARQGARVPSSELGGKSQGSTLPLVHRGMYGCWLLARYMYKYIRLH